MAKVEVTEIEDMETWNAVVKKDNEDLNIIDVYAKWCGPCMCLENTFKAILLKNQDVLSEALEAEKKKEVKFWKICAETMGGPDGVLDLTQFENDPCSHFMVYMRGDCKETIAGPNAPQIKKIMQDLLEEFHPQAE